jgi:hypothetical protein
MVSVVARAISNYPLLNNKKWLSYQLK